MSPLLAEKDFDIESMKLKKNNKSITNNKELAETFNRFFSNIVSNLNIDSNLGHNS